VDNIYFKINYININIKYIDGYIILQNSDLKSIQDHVSL